MQKLLVIDDEEAMRLGQPRHLRFTEFVERQSQPHAATLSRRWGISSLARLEVECRYST